MTPGEGITPFPLASHVGMDLHSTTTSSSGAWIRQGCNLCPHYSQSKKGKMAYEAVSERAHSLLLDTTEIKLW